jgi:ABC-type transport system substrate-binding protein
MLSNRPADASALPPTRQSRSLPRWSGGGARAAAMTAVVALALSSCTTSDGQDAASGEEDSSTFTIGIGVDLDTVDPAQQTTTTVQNVVDYGVETLTDLDQEGEPQPGLATSWETSEDGKVFTLQLREGVTFHDGTPFDAEAVKFNLDRIRDPKITVPIGGAFTVIEEVEVVDEATVTLRLKYPDPSLANNLGITTAGIVSPTSATEEGNTYGNIVNPVGTGPYVFKSFRKGDKAVFEKYDDYWGEKPYYDTVEFKIIPEGNSREAVLRSGEAQMIMNPPVTDLEALESDPEIEVLTAPSDRAVFVAFNNSKPPFDEVKVRQALNYAVDKESIVKNVLFDTVDVMDSPLASTLNGYCSVGSYEYDPEKAKELLAEAGAEDLSVTFGTPSGRYLQDKQAAQAIASQLREVGVDATIRTTDWPSYLAGTNEKDGPYDMHLLGWAPGALDAPTQFQMFQKEQWPPNGLATAFYTSEKAESLIAEGSQELDDEKRNKLYCEAQEQIWEEAPWLFLWSQTLVLAHSSDVAGISYIPNEKFDTVYAHPAE